MPAKQCPWSDQPCVAQRARQLDGCRCEQRTISRTQLDVLQVQAAATANERAKQSPKSEVEEGENHAADPPRPRQSSATRLLAPIRESVPDHAPRHYKREDKALTALGLALAEPE